MGRTHKANRQRGTTIVEFGVLFPLIIAVVFGIIEAGWALEQRHGNRADSQQLARLAAVNFEESTVSDFDELLSDYCDGRGLSDDAVVSIELPDGSDTGDRIVVTVTHDLEQVTGFFGSVLNGKAVSSTATSRLEQDAAFDAVGGQQCDGTVVVTPTPTPAPQATPTPVPAPTATPEPEATATPEPDATATPEPDPTATPSPTTCTVPDFEDVRKNNATALWTSAGFTGDITFESGSGNYRIDEQSIDDGSAVDCDTDITVGP